MFILFFFKFHSYCFPYASSSLSVFLSVRSVTVSLSLSPKSYRSSSCPSVPGDSGASGRMLLFIKYIFVVLCVCVFVYRGEGGSGEDGVVAVWPIPYLLRVCCSEGFILTLAVLVL